MARGVGRSSVIARWSLAAAGALCALSAGGIGDVQAASELLLGADFEQETVIPSRSPTYDLLRARLPSGKYTGFPVLYEAGTDADRVARVIEDPSQAGNHVLQFWLKNAVIPGAREGYYKGRVQLNLGPLNETFVAQRVRMYLHPDLVWYRAYPKANTWFVISELWSGGDDYPYPFKITLNLAKAYGTGKPLYFQVTGDIRIGGTPGHGEWETVWRSANKTFAVPVGEWIDVEVGYLQGDAQTGRFYLAVKRASDPAKTVVLNVRNWTYHPDAPQPVPLTAWQPVKLYTSGEVVDYVRQHGGVAQIYWDDLETWVQR